MNLWLIQTEKIKKAHSKMRTLHPWMVEIEQTEDISHYLWKEVRDDGHTDTRKDGD